MTYDQSMDCPHTPSPDKYWQESDAYWFYDAEQGVGGFHRIGQKPNIGTGQATAFAFKKSGERFVLNDSYTNELTITPEDRWKSGHRVGRHIAESIAPGKMHYAWDEQECSANLEYYESFYAPRDWSKPKHSGELMDNINSDGHLECSGKLRGQVKIAGNTYDIDALCHRDRSWGFRDTSRASLHRYRMFSGTAGSELSFAAFLLDLKGGPGVVAGFVSRNGVDQDVSDLRCMVTFDSDGLSPIGATAILTLETGEEVRIQCQSVQGFMTPLPDTNCATSDTISTFEYEGKTGFLDLELCNNPGRGIYIPTTEDLTLLAINCGVSKSASYEI